MIVSKENSNKIVLEMKNKSIPVYKEKGNYWTVVIHKNANKIIFLTLLQIKIILIYHTLSSEMLLQWNITKNQWYASIFCDPCGSKILFINDAHYRKTGELISRRHIESERLNRWTYVYPWDKVVKDPITSEGTDGLRGDLACHGVWDAQAQREVPFDIRTCRWPDASSLMVMCPVCPAPFQPYYRFSWRRKYKEISHQCLWRKDMLHLPL